MLSVEEKVLLLDEVACTARSSWQIQLAMHDDFISWPNEDRWQPAYMGYCNLRNLLSVSLMTACYALVETGKRAYSLHHAVSDPTLHISATVRQHCDVCFGLRSKIAKYRNNVATIGPITTFSTYLMPKGSELSHRNMVCRRRLHSPRLSWSAWGPIGA